MDKESIKDVIEEDSKPIIVKVIENPKVVEKGEDDDTEYLEMKITDDEIEDIEIE